MWRAHADGLHAWPSGWGACVWRTIANRVGVRKHQRKRHVESLRCEESRRGCLLRAWRVARSVVRRGMSMRDAHAVFGCVDRLVARHLGAAKVEE